DALHQVDVVLATPIAATGVGELAIGAARPARIGEEHHESGRGQVLELVEPTFTVCRMRATVDVEHQRILLPGLVAIGLHQPALDLEIVDGLVGEAFRVGPGDLLVQGIVEAGELLFAGTVDVRHEEFVRMRQVSREVDDLRVRLVVLNAGDFAATAEDRRYLLAHGIELVETGVTASADRHPDLAVTPPLVGSWLVLPVAEHILRLAAVSRHHEEARALEATGATDERQLLAIRR